MDAMDPEIPLQEKQYTSKMDARQDEISKEFSEMGVHGDLVKGICQYGLEKPSAAHQRGIVPFGNGLDVIYQALSITIVTLCCGILQRLDYESKECQALVLVPTRDLVQKVKKVIEALGQFLDVKVHACTGGTSGRLNQKKLLAGVQVVAGTPDRVLDMLQRKALCPDHIRMLVLDEADELLTGGFKNQTNSIIQVLKQVQIGVFSGKYSTEALNIIRWFMHEPMRIVVPKDEELNDIGMRQFFVKIDKEKLKLQKLCDLIDTMAVTQCIIFVKSHHNVKLLTEKFRGKGYTVSGSHGAMKQQTRDTAIQAFRSGSSSILVATDLRGTDLEVPVVIIYDLPKQLVEYIRRVQQGVQSGRRGVVISMITGADKRVKNDIQRFCKSQLDELPSNFADLLIGSGEQKQNLS